MPRGYVKKQRPKSYYTAKGLHTLQKAIRYLEKVGDMRNTQTLKDLQKLLPIISEFHTLVLMQEQGADISQFLEQTTLETSDPEILQILKEAES